MFSTEQQRRVLPECRVNAGLRRAQQGFVELRDDVQPAAVTGRVFEEELGAAGAGDQTPRLQGQDAEDLGWNLLRNLPRFQKGCGTGALDHQAWQGAHVAETQRPCQALLLLDSPAA